MPKPLHEAVARALCAERGYDPDAPTGPRWEDYAADARLAVRVCLAEAQSAVEALGAGRTWVGVEVRIRRSDALDVLATLAREDI